jgi:hypothetical protein
MYFPTLGQITAESSAFATLGANQFNSNILADSREVAIAEVTWAQQATRANDSSAAVQRSSKFFVFQRCFEHHSLKSLTNSRSLSKRFPSARMPESGSFARM